MESKFEECSPESLCTLGDSIQTQADLFQSRSSQFEPGLRTLDASPPPAQMTSESRLLEQANCARELHAAKLGTNDPVVKLAYRCLVEQFDEMLAEAPRAWEGLDPEGVHQMRVATRRLRAAFRAFRKVLPASAIKDFNQEFKWVAAVLGDVRDLDVYCENFRQYTSAIPHQDRLCLDRYQEHLAENWRTARKALLECLSGQRYEKLKDDFRTFLMSEISGTVKQSAGSLTIGDAARRFIGRQYRKVLNDGRSIGESTADEKLHELRIDCKRLRYLFEFFRPVYGGSLSVFIKRLKHLQDVLGEFQDACVATDRLRQYAESTPLGNESRGELLALGQLINTQYQEAGNKRADFGRVWKKFDRKGERKKLISTLENAAD